MFNVDFKAVGKKTWKMKEYSLTKDTACWHLPSFFRPKRTLSSNHFLKVVIWYAEQDITVVQCQDDKNLS